VALFVIEKLGGVSCVGFAYALAEGVVAVAGGLRCYGVGGCDAPSCGVVAARKRGQVTLLVTKSNLTPLWDPFMVWYGGSIKLSGFPPT